MNILINPLKSIFFLLCSMIFHRISAADLEDNLLRGASFDRFMSFGGSVDAIVDGDKETCVFLILKNAFPGVVDLHKSYKFTSISLLGQIGATQEIPSVKEYEKLENMTYQCRAQKCYFNIPNEDFEKFTFFNLLGAAEIEACEIEILGSLAWVTCNQLAFIGFLAILSPPLTLICCFVCKKMSED